MLRNVLVAQGVRGALPPQVLPGANGTRCRGRARFVGEDPNARAAAVRGLADPLARSAEEPLASAAFGNTDSRAGLQKQLKNSRTDGVGMAQHFLKV